MVNLKYLYLFDPQDRLQTWTSGEHKFLYH